MKLIKLLEPEDKLFFMWLRNPINALAPIAALIEQYTFYNADKSMILRQLDKKNTFHARQQKEINHENK